MREPEERPKPPWHPFPLIELLVLAGIVLLIVGFLNFDSDQGRAMLVSGMLLGSLGGLDTALREHFGGYRSHTMIISGLLAVGLAAILYFAGAPWVAIPVTAVVVFVGSALLLIREYKRRER